MSNLFDDFDFDDDEPAPTPDWLREVDDKGNTIPEEPAPASAPAAAPGIDVDRLREKSARAGAMDDAMTSDAAVMTADNRGGGTFFSRMSPAQRLIIALFFLVDLCVVGAGLLLLLNVF